MGVEHPPSPTEAAPLPGGDPPGVPRAVEPLAVVHLLISSPHLVVSWVFLLVATLVFCHLGLGTGAAEWLAFRGPRTVAEGTWSQPPPGSAAPGEVYYTFMDSRGRQRLEVQQVSGAFRERLRERGRFSVVYPQGDPDRVRIAGTRRDKVPLWPGLFLLAALLLGYALFLLLTSLNLGWERLGLLRGGQLAGGFRVKEEREFFVPFFPLHRVSFEFVDSTGTHHRVHSETLHPERGRDQERELFFYYPEDLDEVVSLGSLPASLRISDDGSVELDRVLPLLQGFVVSMLCLAGILVQAAWTATSLF